MPINGAKIHPTKTIPIDVIKNNKRCFFTNNASPLCFLNRSDGYSAFEKIMVPQQENQKNDKQNHRYQHRLMI